MKYYWPDLGEEKEDAIEMELKYPSGLPIKEPSAYAEAVAERDEKSGESEGYWWENDAHHEIAVIDDNGLTHIFDVRSSKSLYFSATNKNGCNGR